MDHNKKGKVRELPAITPAKPVNPMTSEKVVLLTPKTKNRLDSLNNELEQALNPLRQKMAEVQQGFINRMTDTVAGYLDGLGIDVDLNLDTVGRTEDGQNLKITFARPQKNDAAPAPEAKPAETENPAGGATTDEANELK